MRQRLLSQFNVAFALMGIIPLLICGYLITVKFFDLSILEGINGVYFLLAVIFVMLGLLAGQVVARGVVQQLADLNVRLQRFHEMQSAFVSNVAHEFRTPLSVVKGSLDNLADNLHGELSGDQRQPVEMCQREIDRLKRLVADLLDIARIEQGRLRMVQEELSLQECLRPLGKSFEGMLQDRGLRLTLDLPATPITVTGDRDRLSQVFINLVNNAIKFTERGGIHIRLSRDGNETQIEIEDTGRGVPQEDLTRIFDKFERVKSSEDIEGTGLGLPITKGIVELHHGRIWAESQLGQGSRFIIRLPLKA
jgi:signal transduction histidine kinase